MLKSLQRKAKLIQAEKERGGKNWLSETYNTLGTYDLQKDKSFKILLEKIEDKVLEFTKRHNSDYRYKIQESWLNVYNKSDYQEYHHHPNSTFSAVYFLKASENCSRIVFENPIEPEMITIKDIKQHNPLTFKTCFFPPVENGLIIFRSYLRHMVEKQNTDYERMTVAANL